MLPFVGSLGQRAGALARNGLAALLALAVCCGPAGSDEPPPVEDQARALADEALRRAKASGPERPHEWTRSVIENALKRAGEAAAIATGHRPPTVPLPAERQASTTAAHLADRPNSGEVLVFLSLAVPAASWAQWAREAGRTGAPLLLRGVAPDGMRATVKAIGARLGGEDAGVAIDPRLFRLFGVERVPATVVVPGGVPACASRSCADDAPPPFDRVTGNIGLAAALEAIAAEGEAGRGIARAHLARLQGEG